MHHCYFYVQGFYEVYGLLSSQGIQTHSIQIGALLKPLFSGLGLVFTFLSGFITQMRVWLCLSERILNVLPVSVQHLLTTQT